MQYQIKTVNQQASLKLIPINQEQIQITLQGQILIRFDQEKQNFPITFSFFIKQGCLREHQKNFLVTLNNKIKVFIFNVNHFLDWFVS